MLRGSASTTAANRFARKQDHRYEMRTTFRLAFDQSSKSVCLFEINLPDESIGIEIGAVIGEIQAGHGIQVVGSLKIAEGKWTRQIRRHSHGIEALHGEGRGNGGEVTMSG